VVKDADEAIARAAASDFGLGANIYTSNLTWALTAMQEIKAGTFWINDPLTDNDAAPFGGMRTVLIADAPFRTPDLPLYRLRNKATGVTRDTSDPGMAFVTGLWRDVSRFKAPHLRGVASRAPYFHNGMAATLADVVEHYDSIDNIGLTDAEKADLTAFLSAL